MKTFIGDIFEGEWDGMVHCANLYHTMGGGIARVIANRFPEVYDADAETAYADPDKLGGFSKARIVNGRDIYNLYGQIGIGNDGHPMNRNARYDAIYDGVFNICLDIQESLFDTYILAFPYKMASDLAGGDWNIVLAILESVESHFSNIEFRIYKLENA